MIIQYAWFSSITNTKKDVDTKICLYGIHKTIKFSSRPNSLKLHVYEMSH